MAGQQPTVTKTKRRTWGLGPQSALLGALLLAPIPAFFAAEARLDLVSAIFVGLIAVIMALVIARS